MNSSLWNLASDPDKAIREIHRLHALASKTADKAVNYAKEAGLLLIQIKKNLPHGQFGVWITRNLSVSARQAQRYIAVAEGKKISPVEICNKNDTMSHLTDEDLLIGSITNPKWIPECGYWYIGEYKNATFHVVPDINYQDGFFVSKLYTAHGGPPCAYIDIAEDGWDGESLYDGIHHSIDPKWVASTLFRFGLRNAEKICWQRYKKSGLSRPFGEPSEVSDKNGCR